MSYYHIFSFILSGICLASVSLAAQLQQPQELSSKQSSVISRQHTSDVRVPTSVNDLPLYFVENQGQFDRRVSYVVPGRDMTLLFTAKGITFAQYSREQYHTDATPRLRPATVQTEPQGEGAQRWILKLDFINSNPKVTVRGRDRAAPVFSYFRGSPGQWRTNVPTYAGVVYENLWPGIDLVYTGASRQMKYHFVVKPGADPTQIRLAYRGASSVTVTDAGQLEVKTPVHAFLDDKPYAYQEVDGQQREVGATYAHEKLTRRRGDAESGETEDQTAKTFAYGFSLGAYDRTRELILDPAVIVYAGFIGGDKADYARDIAVDGAGNAYVTGYTYSAAANFPEVVGPDLTLGGNNFSDAFVAKVNAAGTALLYAGFIGGNGIDYGTGIAVDRFGNAYVVGSTRAHEATFPKLVGPDLTHNSPGSDDAFIAKVNATGTALVYCGFIGGNAPDWANGVAVDSVGNAYVTGETYSHNPSFPTLVGPDVTFNSVALSDAFVTKVNAAGTGFVYSGFIGGVWGEYGLKIAVDGAGAAYITGLTNSLETQFPDGDGFGAIPGIDRTNNGEEEIFVAKVTPSGSTFAYATYIGGIGEDFPGDIAVDSAGSAYVTGLAAWNSGATFPDGDGLGSVPGPDKTHNGHSEAFVAKLNPSGTAYVYAGYIGGFWDDGGTGIAVDRGGNAYVTGYTSSPPDTFPVKVGPDLTYAGNGDGFVAKVRTDGLGLTYAGYVGGNKYDSARAIAVDKFGSVYVAGDTLGGVAPDPFPVKVGPDLIYNGGLADAFVAKIAQSFGAWTALPDVRTSPSGPTGVLFGGQLFVFIRGSDNLIYARRFTGAAWTVWGVLPGGQQTLSEPAATVFNNQIHLFVRGPNNRIYLNRYGSAVWSGWTEVPGNARTTSGPGAVVYNSQLHLFVRAGSGLVYQNRLNGGLWSGWIQVPGGKLTAGVPTPVVFQNTLRLVVQGTDNRVHDNVMSVANTWSGWLEIPGGMITPSGLGAAVYNGALWYFARKGDNLLYMNRLVSGAGENWGTVWSLVPGGGGTLSRIGATATSGPLYLLRQGTDSRIYINQVP